ncbi:MAG: 30S ribosomal protein S20 [Acholeplasmatales bacterium]|nr:30S ribosomal protein S20 [Acholeplasmatales bacterium]
MANIKQQVKRNKTNEKARKSNGSFKSSVKTSLKKVLVAVGAKDKASAVEALNFAFKKLDKAQSKGIYHKNFVARHKSSLSLKVNSL